MENLAYTNSDYKLSDDTYYKGIYFYIGDNAKERASKNGGDIISVDISKAKLFTVDGNKDANKLKRLASHSGFDITEENGIGESIYLDEYEYDGIKKRFEVILFHPEKFNIKTINETFFKKKKKLILSQLQLDKIKEYKNKKK